MELPTDPVSRVEVATGVKGEAVEAVAADAVDVELVEAALACVVRRAVDSATSMAVTLPLQALGTSQLLVLVSKPPM